MDGEIVWALGMPKKAFHTTRIIVGLCFLPKIAVLSLGRTIFSCPMPKVQ